MPNNKGDPRETINEIILIGRVFGAAIAGFMILVGMFAATEVDAVIRGALLLFVIGIATVISVGAMLLLMEIGDRFLRIFKDE